jgi:hypothetical protein
MISELKHQKDSEILRMRINRRLALPVMVLIVAGGIWACPVRREPTPVAAVKPKPTWPKGPTLERFLEGYHPPGLKAEPLESSMDITE